MTAVSREVRGRLATLAAAATPRPWTSPTVNEAYLRAASPDVVSGLLADLTAAVEQIQLLLDAFVYEPHELNLDRVHEGHVASCYACLEVWPCPVARARRWLAEYDAATETTP